MRERPDLPWLIALILISTLLLFNLFTKGIYGSHDSEVHIARITQFHQALKHQYPPVRWLSNFNFGFGYPTFVYAYSLPYYLSLPLAATISDVEITFKLLMLLSVIFSAITFYYFAKFTFSRLSAFVGSVFYISAPYRFADIYERGALGEALSFVISPLMAMSPYIISRNKFSGFIFTTLVVFTFIGTHAITFIIFLFFTIATSPLIFKKHLKLYLIFLAAIVLGFLLSSFQWIPMISEQKYVNLDKTYFNIFEGHLLSIYQLLRIPKDNVSVGTGIQLGIAQFLVLVLSILAAVVKYIKNRKVDAYLLFFIIAIFLSLILITDFSKFIWYLFHPLQTIIFPWRFLTLTTFATAFLAAYLISSLRETSSRKKQIFVIVIALTIAIYPSRHFMKGKYWHTYTGEYYRSYQDPYKLDNYYLPGGVANNLENLQLPQVSLISGNGQAELVKKQNNKLEANLNIQESAKVQLHTMYFPGWELFINGQGSQLITNQLGLEGIIVAHVPQGSHQLTLEFKETPLRRKANLLTVTSFLILLLLILKFYFSRQSSKALKHVV